MAYIPERGDLVWIVFDTTAGHEQAGRRPALVLSPAVANQVLGLGYFCPITSTSKGYPFEVAMIHGGPVSGVLLVDQIRAFDWRARKATFIAKADAALLAAVTQKLKMLLPL